MFSGPNDAPLDGMSFCAEQPGTRFMMSSAVTFGTQPSAGFTGQVCVEGTTNCVTPPSNAQGRFFMCVPDGGFGLEFVAPQFDDIVIVHGEGSLASGFRVPDTAFAQFHLWTPAGAATYPATTKGFLRLEVLVDRESASPIGIDGVTFTIAPAPTRPVVYVNDAGDVDVTLTTTSKTGAGLVADVDPAMYDISVTGANTCHLATGAGFESPMAGAIVRVPVFAGKATVALLYCTKS